MSKLLAEVKFKNEKNVKCLIRAFFKDFNPESSILVRGNEAKMEVFFREPPMAIIEAIGHCKVIQMKYGKNLEDETVQSEAEAEFEFELGSEESEKSEQTEQESEESENPNLTELESEASKNSERTETGCEETKSKIINIPELKEIAKKATSFDNFAELIAKWLEMDKRQEFFKNLIIVSADVDKITWKDLEKNLKNNNIAYTQWDRIWASKRVSEKLKDESVTMFPLLNAIVEYKGYSFKQKQEQSEKEKSTEEATENAEENSEEANETVFPRPRVKMECMPEIKGFEETLASVDKTQPVEERVRYVLEAMGLSELPAKEQKQIIEIASTALRKGRMAFDIIFVEAKIPIEQTMTARMTFSKFVNDFVQKYESDRKVKLLTFLSELQKIIMHESEIENFSDFTD